MTEGVTPAEEAYEKRKEAAIAEAREHIGRNITKALDGRKCVDDRYEPDTGQIARAGGDMGYVEILLALKKRGLLHADARQCFDYVYDYVTKDNGMFYMHTDEEADPTNPDHAAHGERPLIGCGHCAKAADPEFAGGYGVDPEDVQIAIAYARSKQNVKMVKLGGGHAAKGTIVVVGKEGINTETNEANVGYTVNATDIHRKSKYFIYDQQRDEAFSNGFLDWLNGPKKLNISRQEFLTVSTQQTDATLHNLAQGTPILRVVIDNERNISEPEFLDFVA